MLDDLIQAATGKNLNTYVTQKIKNVTGMNGAYIRSGYNNVYYSTPRSMARFGLLLLNKGNWNGAAVLSDANYFEQMTNSSQNINPSYGYLCWLNGKSSFMIPQSQFQFSGYLVPNAPADMYAALGKNGQIINVVPSKNLVWIRMGNVPEEGDITTIFDNDVWTKLNDIMCSQNTGIGNTQANQTDCILYLNPATEKITVEMSQQNFNINIYDIEGNLVWEKSNCFDAINIDVKTFVKGLYIVQVQNAKTGKVSIKKLSFVN
jgi:CubicO group peptidase (beta-lactamase class C family)